MLGVICLGWGSLGALAGSPLPYSCFMSGQGGREVIAKRGTRSPNRIELQISHRWGMAGMASTTHPPPKPPC